jgi:hypothetical protein
VKRPKSGVDPAARGSATTLPEGDTNIKTGAAGCVNTELRLCCTATWTRWRRLCWLSSTSCVLCRRGCAQRAQPHLKRSRLLTSEVCESQGTEALSLLVMRSPWDVPERNRRLPEHNPSCLGISPSSESSRLPPTLRRALSR